MELQGKHTKAIVYTDAIEEEAIAQITNILDQPMMEGVKVRIMPDTHKGAGICIGYTATLNDYIVPNFIGVDIGCGVSAIPLINNNISFPDLDRFIRENIPSGHDVNEGFVPGEIESVLALFSDLCYDDFISNILQISKNIGANDVRILRALGSLGGGNHFMSVDQDSEGKKYFVVHSGSRNFGKRIAEYHQKKAADVLTPEQMRDAINKIKETTPKQDIGKAIQDFRNNLPKKAHGLEYLEGELAKSYFYDMKFAQIYAQLNRRIILWRVTDFLDQWYRADEIIESVHNYINFDDGIIRKGAISAHNGEKVLIPLSMADGILYCEGKGNEDWNCSAPHGAGRLMSRTKAKATISVEDYKKRMDEAGVWTSCVGNGTLDEAPQAYKKSDVIKEAIGDTVTILDQWKEVYNFKAVE
jgi:RNA-splicing ligase RtcB